jgi:hypothetical protein|tara:strand:- start:468 stop:587 length:120 start_codon:yes stop_codon:yes gene_type:complete
MKKPDITEGNWFVEEKYPSSDWGLNWSVRSRTIKTKGRL